ncbi:SpoIIE family protein phosphatase [Streptomyces collinus]|uniref:SpoIIE family protein phosphatase n=1 Tax=Streptomyces collinus TaxID=42684 RepID=UPI0036CDA2C7
MSELNAYLHRYHRGQMATACYLLYRRSTRTSTYVKAGHSPPLVVVGDGTSRYLDGPISPPVGPVPGARYLQLSQAAGHALADRMSQPTGTHPWAGRTLTAVWERNGPSGCTWFQPDVVLEVAVDVARDASGRWRHPARPHRIARTSTWRRCRRSAQTGSGVLEA